MGFWRLRNVVAGLGVMVGDVLRYPVLLMDAAGQPNIGNFALF